MRVFIDDQIFSMHVRGGISRYFVELMLGFRSAACSTGVALVAPEMWTKNRHMLEAGMGRRVPTPLGRCRPVVQALNRPRGVRAAIDIVHHTYYYGHYLDRSPRQALRVTTIYDMIPELYPHLFPAGNPHLQKREFVESADLIVCISESAKRDLLAIYGAPKAPVVVTPLGVSNSFRPGGVKPNYLPRHYLLFVGARGGYKDFDVLARAFAAAQLPRGISLLAVGGGPFNRNERRLFRELKISDRVAQSRIGDEGLPAVYGHALAFVFPSRYEGFGLPTVEAMASGCPTILAHSSSHPEVGGEAAMYFTPGDVHGLAQVIEEVVSDAELRKDLRHAGLLRSGLFTWQRTAAETAHAYRQIAK